MKKVTNYLSNKDLHCEILVSKAKGRLTPEASQMIQILGNNVIRKFKYYNPDDRYDALNNGLLMAYTFWYNYNESVSCNAFAYFTEVIKRGIAAGWNEVSKNRSETISINGMYEDGNDFDI